MTEHTYNYGPAYGPIYGPPPPPPPQPRNGLGLAAAIIAPIGVLFGLVPLTGFLAFIAALVAIPLGAVGYTRVRRGTATNGKTALTGLGLGVVAAALGIWGMVTFFGAVGQLAEDLNEIGNAAPTAAPAVPAVPSAVAPADSAPAASADNVGLFGDTFVYDDGLEVTMARPQPYEPSQYASPKNIERAVLFEITITNNSATPYEFNSFTSGPVVTAGGQSAEQVFDYAGNVATSSMSTVLPGSSYTYSAAFNVPAETSSLQAEWSRAYGSEDAIFTGQG